MCSIVGLIDRSGQDVSDKIIVMLQSIRHRGPDGSGVLIDNKLRIAKKIEDLALSNVKGSIGIGSCRLEIIGGNEGIQPLSGCQNKIAIVFNGEIYNYKELSKRLLHHDFSTLTDTEVVVHLFEENLKDSNLVTATRKTMNQLDGMYAFALLYADKIILCRDPVGIKPVYFVDEGDIFAFASERKALWKIGLTKNIIPLEPGFFEIISKKSLQRFTGVKIKQHLTPSIPIEDSVKELTHLLIKSVGKTANYKRIGILFSGGLDSSIIAKIAESFPIELILYCAGFQGSKDILNARKASKLLGMQLHEYIIDIKEVRDELPRILYAIEDVNMMNLCIAIPIYFATQMAKQEGIKVMLSGQGADEIFGGYKRYENIMEQRGENILQRELWMDVLKIAHNNLQRDDAASMANSIEVRVPYLDLDFLKYAMQIPTSYKVMKINHEYVRKYILRQIARALGVPEEICVISKTAAQFGSGSISAVKVIVRSETLKKVSSKDHYNSEQAYIDALALKVGIPKTK